MFNKSKSNKSLLKNRDLSIQHLNKINNFLDNEQNLTMYITKEIKNQIHLGKKNEQAISQSISKINETGQFLIRKYEEEIQINEKLEFLVKHIEEEIYKAKFDKSIDLKNKIETDQLQQYTNVLQIRQKDLEKVCQKTNTSSYELSKKLDAIRALRSERTIFSSLFDKIQRQLCNLQHCYKVLVIQRTIYDHEYEQKVKQFNKSESSANRELNKILAKRSKDLKIQKEQDQIKNPTMKVTTERESSFRDSFLINLTQQSKDRRIITQSQFKEKEKTKQKKQKLEGQILNIQRQKKVKLIFNDFGISSIRQLPSNLQDIEATNENLLKQVSQIYEDMLNLEDRIKLLARKKTNRDLNNRKVNHLTLKNNAISKVNQQIRQNRLELRQFKQGCKILYQSIQENLDVKECANADFLNEEQQIIFYMGILQKYFSNSYCDQNIYHIQKPKKEPSQSKRLTNLLSSHEIQRNNMSIYGQKDLLDYAKKNLGKMEKVPLVIQKQK